MILCTIGNLYVLAYFTTQSMDISYFVKFTLFIPLLHFWVDTRNKIFLVSTNLINTQHRLDPHCRTYIAILYDILGAFEE